MHSCIAVWLWRRGVLGGVWWWVADARFSIKPPGREGGKGGSTQAGVGLHRGEVMASINCNSHVVALRGLLRMKLGDAEYETIDGLARY